MHSCCLNLWSFSAVAFTHSSRSGKENTKRRREQTRIRSIFLTATVSSTFWWRDLPILDHRWFFSPGRKGVVTGGVLRIHHRRCATHDPSDLYVCQSLSSMRQCPLTLGASWKVGIYGLGFLRQTAKCHIYFSFTDLAPLLASLPLSATCRVHSREDRMIHHEQNSYTRDRSKETAATFFYAGTAATFLGILTNSTNTYLHRCACQIVQTSGAPSGRVGSNSCDGS
jgi:hypothetical protein